MGEIRFWKKPPRSRAEGDTDAEQGRLPNECEESEASASAELLDRKVEPWIKIAIGIALLGTSR